MILPFLMKSVLASSFMNMIKKRRLQIENKSNLQPGGISLARDSNYLKQIANVKKNQHVIRSRNPFKPLHVMSNKI